MREDSLSIVARWDLRVGSHDVSHQRAAENRLGFEGVDLNLDAGLSARVARAGDGEG